MKIIPVRQRTVIILCLIKILFSAKDDNVVNYVHQQMDYVDFDLRQKLTQHKFSQIGPRIAKGDLNKDGKEDLIIGSTNTLPTTVLLRKGCRIC